MKRRVIKQGHNTLTITLPAQWVKANSINAGEEVNILTENNNLTISKEGGNNVKRKLTIDLKSNDYQFIRLTLNNIYRMGVDVLRVNFKTNKQFEYVQEISNLNLIGFEVVKKGKDYCVLENIAEPSDGDINVLLRRIFLIIKETLEFLEEDLSLKDHTSINYIIQQSKKIEQFDNFAKRLIYKGKIENLYDSHFYWLLLHYLQLIGRAFYHMYKFIEMKEKIEISDILIKNFGKMRQCFNLFYDNFFQKNIEGIGEANKRIKDLLYNDFYQSFPKFNDDELIIAHWVAEINRIMTLFISPSLGIVYHGDTEEV
tara:strand:- start:35411 stop:36352 length:942 start_codon:yes stop_codon:yes gene_type:complete